VSDTSATTSDGPGGYVARFRLQPVPAELFRRKVAARNLTQQTVLVALVNAYLLGEVEVLPNGRYRVVGHPVRSVEDEISVSAPTLDNPGRRVTIRQPSATGGKRLGTAWLADHLATVRGKPITPATVRRLLRHLEEEGRVEPRTGRYWSFDGVDDPAVITARVAMDDGTLDAIVQAALDSKDK